ncbi:MAG: hypothetical protein IPK82_16515 [Polyangiaceae bacterium]|nr:hypothetical protein [Polyangiaceae bacterium]
MRKRALSGVVFTVLASCGEPHAVAPNHPKATAQPTVAVIAPPPPNAAFQPPNEDATYPFDPFDALRVKVADSAPLPPAVKQRFGALPPSRPMEHVAVSPDGALWATCDTVGIILLWDAKRGSVQKTLGDEKQGRDCRTLFFSADGKRLIAPAYEAARVFDLETGKASLATYGGTSSYYGSDPHGWGAAPLKNGGFVVATCRRSSEEAILVFDKDAGSPSRTMGRFKKDLDEHCAYSIAASADGKWIAAGGRDHVYLFDAKTGEEKAALPGNSVHAVAFSPDGGRIYIAERTAVNAFDMTTHTAVASYGFLDTHVWVESIAISPDNSTLFAPSRPGVKAFDTASRREIWQAGAFLAPRFAASPTGELLTLPSYPRVIARFSKQGERLGPYDRGSHDGVIRSIAFVDKDTRLLTAADDGETRVWDVEKSTPLFTFARRPSSGSAIASPRVGTREVVTVSTACALTVWNMDTRVIRGRLNVMPTNGASWCSFRAFALSPDGNTAALNMGSHIQLVNVETLALTKRIELQKDDRTDALQFSADGHRLWVGVHKAILEVDLQKGQVLQSLDLQNEYLRSFTISANGKVALIGTTGMAFAMSIADKKTLWEHKVSQEQFEVTAALFLPGDRVALGVRGGVVLVDEKKGAALKTLNLPDVYQGVGSLAVSENGKVLAAGAENVVWTWDL